MARLRLTAPVPGSRHDARPRVQRQPEQAGAGQLLYLQRAVGNAAVAELLGAKKDYIQAQAANAWIAEFLEGLPGAGGASGGKAVGQVLVEDPATFKAALGKYAEGRRKGDKAYDPKADAAGGDIASGFVDAEGNIHIREGQGEPTTTIHEAFHLREASQLKSGGNFNASEGLTELWTVMLCKQHKLDRGEHYEKEMEAAQALVDAAGMEAVARLYFAGDVSINRLLFDQLSRDQRVAGVISPYAAWLKFMKAGKFDEAKKVLSRVEAKP